MLPPHPPLLLPLLFLILLFLFRFLCCFLILLCSSSSSSSSSSAASSSSSAASSSSSALLSDQNASSFALRADEVALACTLRHRTLPLNPSPAPSIQAVVEAFERTDTALLSEAAKGGGWQDGAAAACVWALGERLVVANVGDVKAVLARRQEDGGGGIKVH